MSNYLSVDGFGIRGRLLLRCTRRLWHHGDVNPNQKKLQLILKAGGETAKELRALVSPNTLRRHLDGVRPTGAWMSRYGLALGLVADDWLSPKERKAELKRTSRLAMALAVSKEIPVSRRVYAVAETIGFVGEGGIRLEGSR